MKVKSTMRGYRAALIAAIAVAFLMTLALAGCGGGGGGGGQTSTTGTVIGTVLDTSTNNPVDGASVSIGTYTVHTGADGAFTLSDVTPGSETLSIAATGYDNYSRSLTVVAGTNNLGNVRIDQTGGGPPPPPF
jgi:hypothetical protein